MKSKALWIKAAAKRLVIMLLSGVLFSGLSVGSGIVQASAYHPGLQIGKPAPSFVLEGLDGQIYRVEGHRDKVLLLNFWASWCEPCRLEAPDLEQLSEKYKKQMDVYGVNVTAYDDEPNVKSFVKEFGVQFPILMDRKEKVYSDYQGQAFPTQVLIDRNGIVRDIIIGLLPPEDLEAKVLKVIKQGLPE